MGSSPISDPLVSIITPSYNKGGFICDTLDSAINQTEKNWELIIVDDGSTDDTLQHLKLYVEKDKRIQMYHRDREPKGPSTCRNIALSKAKGQYVIFLDADDLLGPDCLEHRVKEISRSDFDFMIFTMGTFTNHMGDSPYVWHPPRTRHLQRFLSHDLPWTITSPIWKREFLVSLSGFDERYIYYEDVEMHTRALLQDDVQYGVSPDKKPDCSYRISTERKNEHPGKMLEHIFSSAFFFIKDYSNLLSKRSHRNEKYLKGTLIAILVRLLWMLNQKDINEAKWESMYQQLKVFMVTIDLFSKKDIFFIQCYVNGYVHGLFKIKGFNYMSKKFFIWL